MSSNTENTLLYITGTVHSGSSLLDMILNMHSDIISTGEVFKFSIDPNKTNCVCGDSLAECSFWSQIINEVLSKKNISIDELKTSFSTFAYQKPKFPLNEFLHLVGSKGLLKLFNFIPYIKRYQEVTTNTLELFDIIHQKSNKSIIVDSTKTATKMKSFTMFSNNVKIIRLIRDGRSFIPSLRKKKHIYGDLSLAEIVKYWKSSVRNIDLMLRQIDDSKVFTMRYEDFCSEPIEYLNKICQFLDLDYEEGLLEPNFDNFHSIPGNPWLNVKRGNKKIQIKQDEKWRTELSDEDLSQFEKLAGDFNRKLGYSN